MNASFSCVFCDNHALDNVFFCTKCQSFQPKSTEIDYYTVFGLGHMREIGMNIDLSKLEKNYLMVQMILHPDRFGMDEKQQIQAVIYSGFVNDAYACLKSPFTRACYILKQAGHDIMNESTSRDNALLLEVMAWEEEKVEATKNENSAKAFNDKMLKQKAILYDIFQASYSKGIMDEAEKTLLRIRYIERILG